MITQLQLTPRQEVWIRAWCCSFNALVTTHREIDEQTNAGGCADIALALFDAKFPEAKGIPAILNAES